MKASAQNSEDPPQAGFVFVDSKSPRKFARHQLTKNNECMDPPPRRQTLLRDPSSLFFQSDDIRRYIIASYWLIVLLALPLWWSTTSIERLSLPTSRVISQARHHLSIPVTISVQADAGGPSFSSQLKESINERIGKAPNRWKGLDIRVNHDRLLDNNVENSVYAITQGTGEAVLEHRWLKYSPQASALSKLTDLLSDLIVPFPQQDHRVAQFAPHYRLSFTLLNEDAAAGASINQWAVSDAISQHVSPILTQLAVLHNFTIESQVQYHAPLAFKPSPIGDVYGITPEDLTVFVNSAEWTLSSSSSNDPVLHFVLFVPSAARRPLHIMDTEGSISASNAFLLPQWGGIIILNPAEQEIVTPIELSPISLDSVFSTFSDHLLTLLGVPKLPSGVKTLSSGNHEVLTEWQLDAVLRHRSLENAKGARDTLQSIVKLVDQIENMPVGQDVKGDVQEALAAIEKMYASSRTSLTETLRHSARAFTLSSRAFFDPGMLALLYFPAEHTYAVYTPLFASAFIPLFIAALKEVKAWRRERRQLGNAAPNVRRVE